MSVIPLPHARVEPHAVVVQAGHDLLAPAAVPVVAVAPAYLRHARGRAGIYGHEVRVKEGSSTNQTTVANENGVHARSRCKVQAIPDELQQQASYELGGPRALDAIDARTRGRHFVESVLPLPNREVTSCQFIELAFETKISASSSLSLSLSPAPSTAGDHDFVKVSAPGGRKPPHPYVYAPSCDDNNVSLEDALLFDNSLPFNNFTIFLFFFLFL